MVIATRKNSAADLANDSWNNFFFRNYYETKYCKDRTILISFFFSFFFFSLIMSSTTGWDYMLQLSPIAPTTTDALP